MDSPEPHLPPDARESRVFAPWHTTPPPQPPLPESGEGTKGEILVCRPLPRLGQAFFFCLPLSASGREAGGRGFPAVRGPLSGGVGTGDVRPAHLAIRRWARVFPWRCRTKQRSQVAYPRRRLRPAPPGNAPAALCVLPHNYCHVTVTLSDIAAGRPSQPKRHSPCGSARHPLAGRTVTGRPRRRCALRHHHLLIKTPQQATGLQRSHLPDAPGSSRPAPRHVWSVVVPRPQKKKRRASAHGLDHPSVPPPTLDHDSQPAIPFGVLPLPSAASFQARPRATFFPARSRAARARSKRNHGGAPDRHGVPDPNPCYSGPPARSISRAPVSANSCCKGATPRTSRQSNGRAVDRTVTAEYATHLGRGAGSKVRECSPACRQLSIACEGS